MLPRSKYLHRRLAYLLPTLFLTLAIGLWADDLKPAAPADNNVPTATPDATSTPSAAPAPGAVLPATGGPGEPDVTKPTGDNKAATPDTASDAPIEMPVVKPIEIHTDRDAEIGHVV